MWINKHSSGLAKLLVKGYLWLHMELSRVLKRILEKGTPKAKEETKHKLGMCAEESQKVHLHISYSLGSIIFLKLHCDLLQCTLYCFIQLKHCTHNSWYFFSSRCWVRQEWVSSTHSHVCNEEYFMVFKSWHIYEWAQKYKRKFRETNKQTSLPHIWSQTPSVPFVAVAGLFIISTKNSLIPIGGPKTCAHKCQCKIAHEKTCFFLWSLVSLETNTTHVCSLSMWQTSAKFER